MRTTIILYEHPKAHGDVINWAKSLDIQEIVEHQEKESWFFQINHGEIEGTEDVESISCMPTYDRINLFDYLAVQKIDKLVLWGAFTKDFLTNLTRVMVEAENTNK